MTVNMPRKAKSESHGFVFPTGTKFQNELFDVSSVSNPFVLPRFSTSICSDLREHDFLDLVSVVKLRFSKVEAGEAIVDF